MQRDLAAWLMYFEALEPIPMELGLERVMTVAKRLQVTSFDCPVIMVAGTNGKGSVVRYLETIFQKANLKAAAYTSPHLIQFNERLRLNGYNIDDSTLCEAFSHVEVVREDIHLTYFEWTTLAALWIMRQQILDVAILEVGLGGRLDVVNVVENNIAIVTSIGLDHCEILGTTREQIAFEKSAIFRKNQFAICGELYPPQNIIEYAEEMQTKLFCIQREFGYRNITNQDWEFWFENGTSLTMPLPKLAIHNAAIACAVVSLLSQTIQVDESAIKQGVAEAFLFGRQQEVCIQDRQVILDVAHNEDSIAWLAKWIKQNFLNQKYKLHGKIFAVFSMFADKAIEKSLSPMKDLIDHWFIAPLPGPRGLVTTELAYRMQAVDIHAITSHDEIQHAFNAALDQATSEDRIVVFGSFYTVEPVLRKFLNLN